jgi:phage/plasmid-associated DNA primase
MQADRARRGGAVMSRERTPDEIADPYKKYREADEAARGTGKFDSAAYLVELAEREKVKAASASNVVSMAGAVAARAATKPAPKLTADDKDPSHVKLGTVVLGVIRDRGDDVLFSDKAAYLYSDGLWKMAPDGAARWLNVEIEKGAKSLKYPSTIKLISETREWIRRHDATNRKGEIPWDAHGMVPTRSGLVNPRTGLTRPMRADDYCTWRIEADYDPAAKCPWWLQMLQDVFADRTAQERADTIGVIQELLGVGLIDAKPRELSRALIFQGGSNFGKSGLLEVMSGLFGSDFNSTPIEALDGAHGLMAFVNRRPWLLHEAFDQRKWHFSNSVKTIVTGEPIAVNVKNGPMLSIRVRAPIFWGTNHPPQFKEATKAITNRLVVIECRREFFENSPVGAAKEAFRRALGNPSNLVLNEEMPGLLAWAVVGLRRALERGRLLLTDQMAETIGEIRRDSNLVAGFLEECCFYDMDKRLSVPDFCLAFSAWWLANKGENRQPPSNESIGKALKAMADQKIALGGEELRDTKRRYHAGIVLNEEGLSYHQSGYESRDLQGKTPNATDPTGTINSLMPPQWLEKQSIKTMRERQMTVDMRTI